MARTKARAKARASTNTKASKKPFFHFRKEIGISEIIATVALALSVSTSIWISRHDNLPHVLQGSGPVVVGAIKRNDCLFISAIPLEFNNDGKTSVTLENFESSKLDAIEFVKDGKVLRRDDIKYELHLSDKIYYPGSIQYLFSILRTEPIFDPSDSGAIEQIVHPSDSYKTNIVIIAHAYKDSSNAADIMLISFDASFSNGQVLPIRAAIPITKYKDTGCGA